MKIIEKDGDKYTRLAIDHKGQQLGYNHDLANKNGLKDIDVNHILDLHEARLDFEALMKEQDPTKEKDVKRLRECAKAVKQLEFNLQDVWGFGQNEDFHTYWYNLPHCACPKMDNDDWVGTSRKIYSGDCPIHGEGI